MGTPRENFYVDKGLKRYFLNIYQYVALNLALCGAVGFYVSSSPWLMRAIFGSPLFFIVIFAPIGIAMYLQSRIDSMSASQAQAIYWLFGAVEGVSLSLIFEVYTGSSIFRCFFLAAAVFGAAALYGRSTSRDLSSIRSAVSVGILGLLVVSILNMFMQSSGLQYIVSWLFVGVFSANIAINMQDLLNIYYSRESEENIEKISILGSLSLFISFINIFISLLRLFGERK